jgi:predicted acylesterase/phospholipase RssA
MSCSIPFIFGYAIYDDIEYMDGALLDPFPILYASAREERVFGINIKRSFKKPATMIEDLFTIIFIPMNHITRLSVKQLLHGSYIELDTNDETVTRDTKHILSMFSSGYRQAKSSIPVIKEKVD